VEQAEQAEHICRRDGSRTRKKMLEVKIFSSRPARKAREQEGGRSEHRSQLDSTTEKTDIRSENMRREAQESRASNGKVMS
jgi:hypothetical protein